MEMETVGSESNARSTRKKKMKKKKSEITRTGTKARVTLGDRESAEEQQPVQKYFITVIAE